MKRSFRALFRLATLLLQLACLPAFAQLADKPSAYAEARRGQRMPAAAARNAAASLARVADRAAFASLARVYEAGTPYAIEHVLFAIELNHGAKPDRVFFINTQRYALHEEFLRAQYLVANLDHAALRRLYTAPDRRFALGTLGWHAESGQWLYEFWEGDVTPPALLRTVADDLAAAFFAPLSFKANSSTQEAAARDAGIAPVTEAQILGARDYMALNAGVATGRLRIVDDIEAEALEDILPTDIVVLREVPLALPPVAGVVTDRPSTVLSHVNLLAKGWGVPNAYLRDASDRLRALDGRWVRLAVTRTGWSAEPHAQPATLPARVASARVKAPNLAMTALLPLAQLTIARIDACGGKAARLGQIEAGRRAGRVRGTAPVPDGFCIPYAQYRRFIAQPAAAARVQAAYATPGFDRSRAVRRRALEALRHDLAEMPVPGGLDDAWRARWAAQLAGAGVFVRSSSNSEDLAGFSGAGLYTTVPNVTRADDLDRAVRTVWASVFNFEAVEARRQAGIADDAVVMGVFVQRAIASASAGVLITRDPFDATHRNVVYVSAKRGIGIKVVEGKRVAEQSMWESRSGAVRRLSRSAEDTELKLDRAGGVVEQALPAASDVLSDETVRRLGRVGLQLEALLGGAQDVEWAIDPQGQVVVLQARPFVERAAP
ncbi:MAG: PEP/pyruvate-binding domain-containing protein [Betaproteobacteria bacterium]